MTLPLRQAQPTTSTLPSTAFPRELHLEMDRERDGIPWLCGELDNNTLHPLVLTLRIHNAAGIPILEGRGTLEAGQRQFSITVQPLGIEAYAHKREAERIQIAQRIWSRRAYGTLTAQSLP